MKKSFSILESFKQNRTRVSPSKTYFKQKNPKIQKIFTFSKQFSQKVKYNKDMRKQVKRVSLENFNISYIFMFVLPNQISEIFIFCPFVFFS